jgi:hypothetical protein
MAIVNGSGLAATHRGRGLEVRRAVTSAAARRPRSHASTAMPPAAWPMSPSTRPAPEGATESGGPVTSIGSRCRHQLPLTLPTQGPHGSPARSPRAEPKLRSRSLGGRRFGPKKALPSERPTRMAGARSLTRCRRRATTTGVAAGVISEMPPRARQLTRPNGVSMTTRMWRRGEADLAPLARTERALRSARQPKLAGPRSATARDRRSSDRPDGPHAGG